MICAAPGRQDDSIHGSNGIGIQEKQKPEYEVYQGAGKEDDSGDFHKLFFK
jgi:hypothetical protein